MDPHQHPSRREAAARVTGAPVRGAAEPRPDADRHRRWWADCRDVNHAHRSLSVLLNRDRVVLVGPPGDPAVLTAGEAGELSAALREAADQARK